MSASGNTATALPELVQAARQASFAHPGKGVMLVLAAPEDCPDTKKFLATLEKVERSLGGGLIVQRHDGSHRKREANSPQLKAALDYFAYDRSPGDCGGNQRGHFPSGAMYINGKEVYRLPKDKLLATISPEDFARILCNKTGHSWNAQALREPNPATRAKA